MGTHKKYPTTFDFAAAVFNEAGVPFLLIGGFAVNSYGITRQTLDVDFMIAAEDFSRVKEVLKKNGYEQIQAQDIFARLKSPRAEWMDIDFMFVDRKTLEPMVADGRQIKIAGHAFTVPSLNHLMALKLHSLKHNRQRREYKDMTDILLLIKKNKIDVKSEDFKNLCLKFGGQELYEEIIKRSE